MLLELIALFAIAKETPPLDHDTSNLTQLSTEKIRSLISNRNLFYSFYGYPVYTAGREFFATDGRYTVSGEDVRGSSTYEVSGRKLCIAPTRAISTACRTFWRSPSGAIFVIHDGSTQIRQVLILSNSE